MDGFFDSEGFSPRCARELHPRSRPGNSFRRGRGANLTLRKDAVRAEESSAPRLPECDFVGRLLRFETMREPDDPAQRVPSWTSSPRRTRNRRTMTLETRTQALGPRESTIPSRDRQEVSWSSRGTRSGARRGMPAAPWGRSTGARRRCVRPGPAGTGPCRAPLGARALTGAVTAMGSAPV
jgi:hypothetical protein